MSGPEYPDEVYTEAHGRILGRVPALQKAFRKSSAWSGEDFERLLVTIWLMGYAGALADIQEGGVDLPDDALPPAMDWFVLRKEKA